MILLNSSHWEIRHTPNKGRALYVLKAIPPGKLIGDYLGKVIHPEEEDENTQGGLYGMNWHDNITYLPQPSDNSHILLINHSCAPNCGIYPYRGHILYISLRKISPGEELTVSYMIEPDTNSKQQYPCLCGEDFCRGTMIVNPSHGKAFWSDFIGKIQQPYLKTLPKYGQYLTPLPKYPASISDNPIWDLFGNTRIGPYNVSDKFIENITSVRNLIRSTGLMIAYPKINLIVIGVLYPNFLLIKLIH